MADSKFVAIAVCSLCGTPRDANERTCRKCGGTIVEKVVKRKAVIPEMR